MAAQLVFMLLLILIGKVTVGVNVADIVGVSAGAVLVAMTWRVGAATRAMACPLGREASIKIKPAAPNPHNTPYATHQAGFNSLVFPSLFFMSALYEDL